MKTINDLKAEVYDLLIALRQLEQQDAQIRAAMQEREEQIVKLATPQQVAVAAAMPERR